jgi:outer membrane protein assembly factor BamA
VNPFLTRHEARVLVAPLSGRTALEYNGHYRRENSARWTELRGEASTLNAVRFHGFGNATEDAEDASRVWLRELILEPRWHLPLASDVEFVIGAGLKYTDPSFESDAPVAALGELGSRPYGQVQARGAFALDRRDNPWFPRKGAEVQVTGLSAQPVSGVDFRFSKVDALASTFITVPIWTRPVVALRGGGTRLWGDFPFHEAAFLGGSNTIRGYQRERFAGDAMLFGNAELRVPLVELELLARGHLGVSGLVDAGRVYFDGESPGGLHRAAGGSLWFVTPDLSLSVSYARGDSHRFDADLGLPF